MQNEIIRSRPKKAPTINWRVYYDDDGRITACSPTAIIELHNARHVQIPAELGRNIVTGKTNSNDYRVVQAAGVMKVVETRLEEKNTRNISDHKTTSGRLRYYQIENLGHSKNFVIGVTPLMDKGKIIFQSNPENQDQILKEIEAGNIVDRTTLFFTKKNDPSWLYFKIEISLLEILRTELIVQPLTTTDLSGFSVFTEYFVEGIKIFNNDEDHKRKDITFHEFVNDFNGVEEPNLVKNIHLSDPVFDLSFEQNHMKVSIGNAYREYLAQYVGTVGAKTELTFSIMDRNSPLFLMQQIRVNLKDLPWNDQVYEIESQNPIIYVDAKNTNQYFRISKRRDAHFASFLRAIENETNPILIEPEESDAPIVVIAYRRSALMVSLNKDYVGYLERYNGKINPKVNITIIGKALKLFELNLMELLNGDIEIGIEPNKTMIYIDVPNPNHYFQIKQKGNNL